MAIITGSFTYPSSIDPTITNLYAKYTYDNTMNNMPVVAAIHGYQGDASSLSSAQVEVMRSGSQAFVVVPGMRGRNGAGGSQDSSGREIHDIVDAIEYVRANFPTFVSQDRAAIAGFSGGGGNAMAAACKFPDYFTNISSVFGMSDYSSWYGEYNLPETIAAWIGGTPTTTPERYAARNAQTAITNYSGGRLYLTHDTGDQLVWVHQTTDVAAALAAAGRTNYETSITSKQPAPPLYSHAALADAEYDDFWGEDVTDRAQAPWTVPESGTLKVIGYLVTKRFSVWLGDGTAHSATVEYGNGAYKVTPSAECEVTFEVNGTTETRVVTTAGYQFATYDFDILLTADPVADYDFDVLLLADEVGGLVRIADLTERLHPFIAPSVTQTASTSGTRYTASTAGTRTTATATGTHQSAYIG